MLEQPAPRASTRARLAPNWGEDTARIVPSGSGCRASGTNIASGERVSRSRRETKRRARGATDRDELPAGRRLGGVEGPAVQLQAGPDQGEVPGDLVAVG